GPVRPGGADPGRQEAAARRHPERAVHPAGRAVPVPDDLAVAGPGGGESVGEQVLSSQAGGGVSGGATMPVHDWTRVDAGAFHSFHTTWVALLGVRLNE